MTDRRQIIEAMKVLPAIEPEYEVRRRVEFIKNTLRAAGMKNLVLGISGGIDSCTCGRLSQLAIDELNQAEPEANYAFYAVRLPYDVQADEADAQASIDFIGPTHAITLNVQAGADSIHSTVVNAMTELGLDLPDDNKLDFAKGNVKARTRMVLQYDLAGIVDGLVLGTDHSAENITGFYTKYGDGAVDLVPLFGLNKRQVRQVAAHLGAPQTIITKAPTADLESLNPGLKDEDALGLTYDEIDDFLEDRVVSGAVENKLIDIYTRTAHKRDPIPSIYDD